METIVIPILVVYFSQYFAKDGPFGHGLSQCYEGTCRSETRMWKTIRLQFFILRDTVMMILSTGKSLSPILFIVTSYHIYFQTCNSSKSALQICT